MVLALRLQHLLHITWALSIPFDQSSASIMTLLLLLSRMNPSACVFGNTDTVIPDDDDIKLNDTGCTDDSSSSGDSPRKSGGRMRPNPFSFGCLSNSKFYSPNDTVQPLSNDAILSSLEKVVPEYLVVIASRPPSPSSGAFSQKEMRKSVKEFNRKKTAALQKLHDLTIKAHQHNRISLVQTDKWDIIHALSMALIESCDSIGHDDSSTKNINQQTMDEERRLICWTINNLSIPYENKATMALGDQSTTLLQALMMVIQSNLPETYLCCVCINNLTFLADAIKPVALFVHDTSDGGMLAPYASISKSPRSSIQPQQQQAKLPPRPNTVRSRSFSANGRSRSASKRPQPQTIRSRSLSANGVTLCLQGEGLLSEEFGNVLGNPSSLLCTIERMMITNAPFLLSDVKSVQGEAIRWSCGFIRNVTGGGDENITSDSCIARKGSISNDFIEEICLLISRTEIPRMVVQFVRESPHPTVKWTKDSLEDICLSLMCNIARFSSRESLMRAGAIECLEKIEALPGIHGYRARAIRVSLGVK